MGSLALSFSQRCPRMRLKLFAFVLLSVYVSVGGLSVVQADDQELPAIAPPPAQAATLDPLCALKERAKHQLFPLTESDEAYKAYYGDKETKQAKTMD